MNRLEITQDKKVCFFVHGVISAAFMKVKDVVNRRLGSIHKEKISGESPAPPSTHVHGSQQLMEHACNDNVGQAFSPPFCL